MEKQKTIKKELKIKGRRHSDGKATYVKFIPCKQGLFVRYKETTVPLDVDIINFSENRHTNSIVVGGQVISTVEHIFSAVNGLGIDNLIIEFESNEPPFFSNSKHITSKLKRKLLELKEKEREYITFDREILIKGEHGSHCKIIPNDCYILDLTIDFDNIIGKQNFIYTHDLDYKKEISFARSFLINEITDLSDPWADNDSQKQTFTHFFSNNPKKCPFITFTKDEYLTPLKDDLEPAKHKALDFIGDIIFLGAIPKARFEIYKPGHAFNRKIVKTISNLKKSERETFHYFLSIIPEALSLKECVENNIVHKDCSVLDHTKMVFLNMMDIVPDEASFLEKGKLFRLKLAIFLHDFGKLHTLSINDDGSTTCAGHEVVSYNKVLENNFLDRFSITEEGKVWILNFIKKHADLHILFDESDNVLRDAFLSFKKDNPGSYMETLIFSIADLKGTHFKEHNKEEYDRRINFLEKLLSEELQINNPGAEPLGMLAVA